MEEQKNRKKKNRLKKRSHNHEHDESCMMGEGSPVHDYDLEKKARKVQKNK